MAGAAARAGRFDAVLVAAAACLVYAAFGQSTLYGIDTWNDLRLLAAGDSRSAVHVLYRPLAAWFAELGAAAGLTLHESVRSLSAVGTAVGVGFVTAASRRLGAGRGEALSIGVWVAVLPALWFYATVAERHGPFFAFAGLSCYCAARWIRTGGVVWSFVFAASVGLAYAAHSTGALLIALLVPWFAAVRHQNAERWLRDAVLASVAAAGAGFLVSRVAFWSGQLTVAAGNVEILGEYASVAVQHLDYVPTVVWGELLWPLMPVSLLWAARWFAPGGRCIGAALTLGISVYLAFSFLVLAGFYAREGFGEFGAYVLPLAWPLAYVAVRTLDRRVVAIGIVASAVLAIVEVARHDTRPTRGVAANLRQIERASGPYLLPAARSDFELLFVEFPEYVPWYPAVGREGDYMDLYNAVHADDHEGGRGIAALLPTMLEPVLASGRPVLLSRAAIEELRTSQRANIVVLGPVFLAALERAFEFEPVDGVAFVRLTPR